MSDSERSAEPIRRHDEPPSHLHPLSPTRAQREASRLTPAARLPRTTARLAPSSPRTLPTSRPISSRRVAGSERSGSPIRRYDETSSYSRLVLPTRANRGASRTLAVGCPLRTTARHEPSLPRAPSAADGRRTVSAAQALIRRHDEPSSHPRPLLPTRAQRGASRPPPVGCLPRTSDNLEPHRLEPSPTHQRKKNEPTARTSPRAAVRLVLFALASAHFSSI